MSDASQTKLSFRDEAVWGEDPLLVSPQAPGREFRFTSESLNFNVDTAVSEEIRDDRNISDIIRVAANSAGDVNIESSFGAHDPLLEGAFFNNWVTPVDLNNPFASPFDNIVITVTAAITSPIQDSVGTISAASGTPFANVTPGDWIRLSNTGSPNVDGYYLVTAKTDGDNVSVSPSPLSSTSGTFRIRASGIRNGTSFKSFFIEKEFRDIGQFFGFTGMRVGTWSQNIAPGSILNGTFGFQGEYVTQGQSSQFLTSPQVEPTLTNDVFNAVDNISNILIDGLAPVGTCFTEVSFTLDNQLRPQPCIGQLANSGIGAGQVQISGTIASYFNDLSVYQKFTNFQSVSLSFVATDIDGNSYLYFFPSFKLTTGEVVAGGNNQDVLATFGFTARRDPTYGFAMGLNRFAADSGLLLPVTATQ